MNLKTTGIKVLGVGIAFAATFTSWTFVTLFVSNALSKWLFTSVLFWFIVWIVGSTVELETEVSAPRWAKIAYYAVTFPAVMFAVIQLTGMLAMRQVEDSVNHGLDIYIKQP